MLRAIANVMEAIWNFIPADVWIWGSIIICVLLKIAGEKMSLWFSLLFSAFGLYLLLRVVDALVPNWIELLVIIIVGIIFLKNWLLE